MSGNRSGIEVRGGVLVGPARNPRIAHRNSVHEDDVARRVGFRGGAVAGSMHLDLFPSLAIDAFGDKWFQTGNVSMYYRNPIMDRESVRAYMRKPERADDVQVDAWVEREDGMRVADGTIAVGNPGTPSALRSKDLDLYSEGEYRILADVQKGALLNQVSFEYSHAELNEWTQVITDKLAVHESSRWGGAVIPLSALVDLLFYRPTATLRSRQRQAFPLFGAIEIAYVNGPAMADRPYVVTGQIIAKGQSPKTEYVWFDSSLADEGRTIAEMRMLLRYMKIASPLYPELTG